MLIVLCLFVNTALYSIDNDCILLLQADKIISESNLDKEYLAIHGDAEFCKLVAQLAFGDNSSVVKDGLVSSLLLILQVLSAQPQPMVVLSGLSRTDSFIASRYIGFYITFNFWYMQCIQHKLFVEFSLVDNENVLFKQ